MARERRPGTVRIEIEIPDDTAARLDEFRAAYGNTRKAEIELALSRHMASPPPVPQPPPPPVVPPLPPVKRGRGRPRKVVTE